MNDTDAATRLPVVAIVGRPNAGKSTLFNRLVRQPRAIVDSTPGVTRDRNIARAVWDDRPFLLVDTGGFENRDASELAASVRAQAALAAEEADVVIALLDGREGVNPGDREFLKGLRKLTKPVVFAVNKLDTVALEPLAADFFRLGIDKVVPVSAAHGLGIEELMEQAFAAIPPLPDEPDLPKETVRLAIIGRPNVGKSSLLNRLVGFERSIVSPQPGTTRDAVDIPFRYGERDYVLVDTAGIRRRPKVFEYVERASAVRALRALERAEVAVLVIDAVEGMNDQDARIAGYALERGRALLIAFNKWDIVPRESKEREAFLERLSHFYPTLRELPTLFLSATAGTGVHKLFPALESLIDAHRRQVRTTELNRALQEITDAQPAPHVRGRAVKFFYATQTGHAPPRITIFTNLPDSVPGSYQRYLANELRQAFGWLGTPLQIRLQARREPRAPRKPVKPGKAKPRKRA